MTEKTEAPGTEEEDEYYIPSSVELTDGGAVIFDQREFYEKYDCCAVHLHEGVMYVLLNSTSKWVNVEDALEKPKPPAKLTTVKKT